MIYRLPARAVPKALDEMKKPVRRDPTGSPDFLPAVFAKIGPSDGFIRGAGADLSGRTQGFLADACFLAWVALFVLTCFCEDFFWFALGDLSPMIVDGLLGWI